MATQLNALAGMGNQINWLNTIQGGVTYTAVRLSQTHEGYTLTLQNPAFREENYYIEVSPNILTIYAGISPMIKAKHKGEIQGYIPSFVRTFPIPNEVDSAQIEAIFESDRLTIKAPFRKDIDRAARRLDIKPR